MPCPIRKPYSYIDGGGGLFLMHGTFCMYDKNAPAPYVQ